MTKCITTPCFISLFKWIFSTPFFWVYFNHVKQHALKKALAENSKRAVFETVVPMVCVCSLKYFPCKCKECCRNHSSINPGCTKCYLHLNFCKYIAKLANTRTQLLWKMSCEPLGFVQWLLKKSLDPANHLTD